MKRAINFRLWLAESFLYDYYETVFNFGKFKGTDHTQVPSAYLQWTLNNINDPRFLPPQFRQEIEMHLKKKPVFAGSQVAYPKSQQSAQPMTKVWVLAKVIGNNNLGLIPNQRVALAKRADGNWDFVGLDKNQQKGIIPNANIASVVQSIKDINNQPMKANNPQEFMNGTTEPEQAMPMDANARFRIPQERISPYQKKIEEAFLNTNQNIVINALAGSGKTSALRHLASFKKPSEKWLYLVFNKKNQVEATTGKSPFPAGVDVKTTHSFLGGVLRNNSKVGKIQHTDLAQGQKIGNLLDGDWFEQKAVYELNVPKFVLWPLKTTVKKLAGLSKAFAHHPNKDISHEIESLIDKYQIDTALVDEERSRGEPRDYKEEIIEMTIDLLRHSLPGNAEDATLRGVRDHDDTLWYAAIHADELHWPHYDVVLLDEVQDFNRAQLIMAKKLGEAGARIVAVGDVFQSLYSFRGADSKAFSGMENLLKNMKGGASTFDLPTNYRSGKNIIDYVNQATHVNNLQAGRSHEGLVTTHQKYDEAMGSLGNEWGKQRKLNMQTAFIARTNKPLVHSALNLLKNNIPFVVIGREFVEEIVKFIRQITGFGRRLQNMPIDQFWRAMHVYKEQKEQQWKGKAKKQSELQEVSEMSEALDSVLGYLEESNWQDIQTKASIRTSEDFVEYLKKVFKGLNVDENDTDAKKYDSLDPTKFVSLTTAHRSKGLEFERVYIIRNDLFPHPSAKTEEELAQEKNAKYVSYTRATHELHVINDTEPGGKSKR